MPQKRLPKHCKPIYAFTIVVCTVFVAELSLMGILHFIYVGSPWIEALVDAFFISIVVSPIIYFILYRPLLVPVDENKRAKEELNKAHEEAEHYQAEVSALLKTSELLDSREFAKTAEAIFSICKEVIGAKSGYIALLSEDGQENEVVFLDAGGLPCDVNPELPMPVRGLRGEAYKTGKAVYDNEFASSEWMQFMPPGHVLLDNVLFAPLTVDEHTIGLIGLANKPGGFNDNDIEIATAFGKITAVTLRNSKNMELLERSEAQFRSVVQTAKDAIVTIDEIGNVVFWNDAAQQLFGYAPEKVLGQPLELIMPARFRQAHRDGINHFVKTGESKVLGKTVELVGLKSDESEFPIQLSLAHWDIAGQKFFTGIIRDISEQKLTENKLQKAYGMLEVRVEERTADLAKANKELEIENEQRKKVESALQHRNQIQHVLNTILNFSIEEHTLEEILDRSLAEIVSVDWLTWESKGAIFIVESNKEELVLKSHSGLHPALQSQCSRVNFGRCICGVAASTKKIQFVDCVDDGHQNKYDGMPEHGHYCVPILSAGTVLGVITLYVAPGHQKMQEEELFLQSIANVLASIIERKEADSELDKHHFHLENLVREKTKDLRVSLERLRKIIQGIVSAMVITVEARDQYTAGHQRRVSNLARAIADEMGLPKEQVDGIRMAGIMHDLGKISIPSEILTKPGKLTDLEFSLVKNHPQSGYEILKSIDFSWPVAKIVLQHHERMDGSGYPAGLSGDQILVGARIIAVADVVEAMASHRPYRPTLGLDEALEEVLQNRGKLYDPEVVDVCLKLFHEKGFKL